MADRIWGLLACHLFTLLAAPLAAQAWVQRAPHTFRALDHGLGGRPTAVGDGRIVAWDGMDWKEQTTFPGTTHVQSAGFDRVRGEVVLITSPHPTPTETWTFDGVSWTNHGVAPSNDFAHLHYDPALGAVVAFEDLGTAWPPTSTQDWRWNGTSWIALPPNQRPIGLGRQLVADTARGRVVAIGDLHGPHADETWEWDGSQWQLRAMTPPPAGREGAALGYDPIRRRVVLFGGADVSQPGGAVSLNDTWEWDGVVWRAVPTFGRPVGASWDPVLLFDPTRNTLVLFHDAYWNPWTFDGTTWAGLGGGPGFPFAGVATDPHRRRMVYLESGLYGPRTFEWDGNDWTQFHGSAPSQPRRWTAMAGDPIARGVILFGGTWGDPLDSTYLDDTWMWHGAGWQEFTAGSSPSARGFHAMAPHAASGGVVLFGGVDENGDLQDTWLFDPRRGGWRNLTPTLTVAPPGGRSLFEIGVRNGDPHLVSGGQLWRFTGAWQLVSNTVPAASPTVLAHDPISGRPVLAGYTAAAVRQSWEWDGVRWIAGAPMEDVPTAAAHDPLRGTLLGFPEYVYTSTPLRETRYGAGCGSPVPAQLTQRLPRIAEPGFRLAAQVEPGATAMFLLGAQQASLPVGGGCTLLVSNPTFVGSATANQSGFAWLPLPIPAMASLRGVDLFAQAVTVQPQGPVSGLGLTGGLRITIGD